MISDVLRGRIGHEKIFWASEKNLLWLKADIDASVARDLSICAIGKMRCSVSKSRTRSLHVSGLNLTLTLILSLAKSRSAFCKLRRLTNSAQHSINPFTADLVKALHYVILV